MKKRILFLALVLLFALNLIPAMALAAPEEAAVFYVVPGGTGDGSSWGSAMGDVQAAIDTAAGNAPAAVYVKEGTYVPAGKPNISNSSNARDVHFSLRNGVTVIGGFGGTETDGVPAGGDTVFSGDLRGDDVLGAGNNWTKRDDNAYHVFYQSAAAALDASAVLRNVTITAGSGAGEELNSSGGGMYNVGSSPTMIGVNFKSNEALIYGGALYGSESSPTLIDCTFTDNTVLSFGGAIYGNNSSSPTLLGCTFTGNEGHHGGAVANRTDSNATLINCFFTGNTGVFGGGLYNNNSSATVVNCTFASNAATDGGGIYNRGSGSSAIINTIISRNAGGDFGGVNNSAYTSTVVGTELIIGAENTVGMAVTPSLFINSDGTLSASSSAIDAGDSKAAGNVWVTAAANGAAPWEALKSAGYVTGDYDAGQITDVNGSARVYGASIDLGAVEAQTAAISAAAPTVLFVAGGGTGDGSTWNNAMGNLQAAIDLMAEYGIGEVRVKEGTYVPVSAPNINNSTDGREVHFALRNNVTVIGGFAGNETDSSPHGGDTILSGDIRGNDSGSSNREDNAYHVFYHPTAGLTASAVLKNVTVTGGNASGAEGHTWGGGMYNVGSSPVITDCVFIGNNAEVYGGAVYNNNKSNPQFGSCSFTRNTGGIFGGAVYNNVECAPVMSNCVFTGNQAHQGGALANRDGSNATITTCTFTGNTAGYGGAVYNNASAPGITGCTITGNIAVYGGGIYNGAKSAPILTGGSISKNTASYGGGIYNNGSTPQVSETKITDNTGGDAA